jgi:hypothetical protein
MIGIVHLLLYVPLDPLLHALRDLEVFARGIHVDFLPGPVVLPDLLPQVER